MTPSEIAARQWLVTQGYSETDIRFHANKSPDFITSDGKRWEVKRLVRNALSFTKCQVNEFQRTADATTILVWQDGSAAPVATTDFCALPKRKGKWGGFKVYIARSHWRRRAVCVQNEGAITRRLRELDRSQGWLARKIGVNPATVHRWIRGKAPILPKRQREIALVLGIRVEDVVAEPVEVAA